MTDTTDSVVETTAPDANATADAEAKPDTSPGAGETSEKPESKDKIQRRFDKLTWQLRQTERERDYERELRLTHLQQQQQSKQAETTQKLKKLADFEYDEDRYAEYVAEVAADKAAAKLQEKQREYQSESTKKERQIKFRELEAKVKTEIEDYEDVAHYARIDDRVAELVMDLDEGPRIAYFLGKNPDVALRINGLPSHLAAIELGRIDQRLSSEREAKAAKKPVSQAPPPPPKIDAVEPAVSKDPSEMNDAEFAKWRRRQIAQRR